MDRLQRYSAISEKLKSFSEEKIQDLLSGMTPLHVGIDGKTFSAEIDGVTVFVKKIPLSALEAAPENRMSTANLYQLPLFCQYGIGAPGFGSWRELFANRLATQWVLSKECENFSLLYHWCVVKAQAPKPLDEQQKNDLEKQILFWENSNEVRRRYEAIHHPVEEIVMFIEFEPQNLFQWIKTQYELGTESFIRALGFVENRLHETVSFMGNKGFLHFDAHFENIMTDGQRLYFNDFGLCLSRDFNLTEQERVFLENHQDYDRLRVASGLAHAVSVCVFKEGNWKDNLRAYLASTNPVFESSISQVLRTYGPPALALVDFFQQLRDGSKNIPFPKDYFAGLLS